jgi:RNA recognition motif-containing protein
MMENIVDETVSINSNEIKKVSVYVGNVPWKATKEEIAELISSKAEVEVSDVRIISEKDTGRSRGFAFVDIVAKSEDDFIERVPPMELNGRTLIFKHANERVNKREDSQSEEVNNQIS